MCAASGDSTDYGDEYKWRVALLLVPDDYERGKHRQKV